MVEIGGYKIKEKGQLRAEKVKIYLTGEELAVVNELQHKLGFATRPPLFRYLLHHYDDIAKAEEVVLKFNEYQQKEKEFRDLILQIVKKL
jgi:hypothetical protein